MGLTKVFLLTAALVSTVFGAVSDKAGVYVGSWSGVSGAAGDFRITLTLINGKLTPEVMFTMGSTEVKTKVTYVVVDNAKLEMKYEFDLGDARLESTLHGTFDSGGMAGTYTTKAVEGGSPVDQGEWKAKRL